MAILVHRIEFLTIVQATLTTSDCRAKDKYHLSLYFFIIIEAQSYANYSSFKNRQKIVILRCAVDMCAVQKKS